MDRKRIKTDGPVKFTVVPVGENLPALEDVTSVAVVAFDQQGQMLVVETQRGPDLPGGHMMLGETSFTQTARRETMEEGFAELDGLRIACLVHVDHYGAAPASYMVIMAGTVTALRSPRPGGDYMGRQMLPPQEFLAIYKGDRDFMAAILAHAEPSAHS